MHMLTDGWSRLSDAWCRAQWLVIVQALLYVFTREEESRKGGLHPDLITFGVQVSLWRCKQLCQRLGVLSGNPVPDCFALQTFTAASSEAKPALLGAVGLGAGGGGGGGGHTLQGWSYHASIRHAWTCTADSCTYNIKQQ